MQNPIIVTSRFVALAMLSHVERDPRNSVGKFVIDELARRLAKN